jgi:hypothetical protein
MDIESQGTLTCALVMRQVNMEESEVKSECSTERVTTEPSMTETLHSTMLKQPCEDPLN